MVTPSNINYYKFFIFFYLDINSNSWNDVKKKVYKSGFYLVDLSTDADIREFQTDDVRSEYGYNIVF